MRANEYSDDEIHNYKKLDKILVKLCHMVVQGQKTDPDKYGVVAAAVLDPDNNLVTGINLPAGQGLRKHAERVAIDNYIGKYGDIPNGSIILTTCSPCSEHMDERYGESCTDLINNSNVRKVYCGFIDPSQEEEHRDFNIMETENEYIRDLCKTFAKVFLDDAPLSEAFDKPYAFNWQRGDHGDWDISVKLPDGSPLEIAFNHEGDNVWQVAFDRGHSQELTGEGDAQRIFATVLTSIQQFIGKQNPDKLYFSASKDVEPGQNSESRAKLYERLVRRYASALGYDVTVDERSGHTMFILDKEQGLTEEEFNGIDITMDIEGDEVMVTAMGNGRELGHVLFVEQGEYLMPQDLEVDERFQGQGIAAAMYDYVKSKGYKIRRSGQQTDAGAGFWGKHRPEQNVWENFADGRVKGKSRPGRVKRAGASCSGSITDLRARAKNASGEKAKMYHWCANMKSGRNK